MTDTKNMRSIIGTATATLLAFPLLLLILTNNDSAGLKVAEAFVTPDGRIGTQQSFSTRRYGEAFSPLNLYCGSKRKPSLVPLPRVSFHLQATDTQQFEEQQQNKSEQDDETSEAKRLLRDAERLRLEAEQMDASLTLQKIAVLEEKLSNDDWLKKQKGQTIKDLYEELRMLEKKISRPNSAVRNADDVFPTPQETDSVSPIVRPPSESSDSSSSSARFDNDKKRTNPNVPPIAGFDDKDLNLYVPVAEDVNKMAPNITLDERIGLFRDAPELQAHFKEKIQNLLLGPLEEMQELETLKQQYLESTSSREKDALLKEIKRLEAKMDANTMGMNSDADTNDPGAISYSKSICLPPDKLPPLTDEELKERYVAIKALPDILVAVYLQRNGLYNIPVPFSTINLQVGSGGINVNMNTVNNSATNADEEETNESELVASGENVDDDEQSKPENDTPFDLYENLELAIELDYYDLQLQLLNQALGIRPMPDEVREEYAAAFRSLPSRVRQRYVVENLGIDIFEASVLSSDEEEDLKRVIDEILTPLDEEISLGSIMDLKNGSGKKDEEQVVVPPEYNDVEFVDRSRYLEEFYPTVAKLEDLRPSAEDVELFMSECLTGPGNKPFMVTSKPERVIGGYYIRGTNQLGYDEENSISANDRLIKEVSERLENNPTLKDKIEFYYILDPYPPTDEEMELEVGLSPLFLITGKDPKTMYGLSSPLTKTAITVSGLLSTFLFSVGSVVLNPKVEDGIQKTLDSVSAGGSTTTYIDVTWFYTLTLPLFFSFMAILFAHELGHRIVATYYKFDIGLPNVMPSATTGLAGAITPIKSPPPNNKALFDFAMAGPLSGLIVSIGLLFVGLELTRMISMDANLPVLPVDLARASSLGGGMIQYFMGKYALLPGQGPEAYVELHPFAIAGWIGCIINSLALLPLGHTDGGRIALTMFGRRGAFITKLFTTLILLLSGLVGFDDMNILLAYAIFVLVWQRELDSPIRNEVDELDFGRGLLGITTAIMVGLVLIPMTS